MKEQLADLLFLIKPDLRTKHKIAVVDDFFPELDNIKQYLLKEIGKESVND